jgi:hypothetical protein
MAPVLPEFMFLLAGFVAGSMGERTLMKKKKKKHQCQPLVMVEDYSMEDKWIQGQTILVEGETG